MSVPIESEPITAEVGSTPGLQPMPLRVPVADRGVQTRSLSVRPWQLALVFLLLQLAAVILIGNGGFTDEGIYVLAGTDPLLGREDDVAYHLWLDGSPYLFPLLSGAAYLSAGLVGSRMMAATLWAIGLVFFSRFVRTYFGHAAALWATLLLCLNGVFFSVAHLAVYDALAFVAFSACLSCAQQLVRKKSIVWVARVSVWAALTVVAKYSAIILLLLSIPVTLISSRRRNGRAVLVCIVFAAALSLAYMAIIHGQIFPRGALYILLSHPKYADRLQLAFQATYLLLLPLALAIIAALQLGKRRARFAWTLVGCGVAWPLLHVLTVESVSLNKHVALSLVFLYPLIGWSFAQWWHTRRKLALTLAVASAVWGAAQFFVLDRYWVDVRAVAEFLLSRLHRQDTVGSESGWDLAMYAVLSGASTPERFVNGWHLRQGQDPCKLAWVIGTVPEEYSQGSSPDRQSQDARVSTTARAAGPDDFALAGARCGFHVVARFPSERYAILPPLVRSVREQLVVYRNPEFDHIEQAR